MPRHCVHPPRPRPLATTAQAVRLTHHLERGRDQLVATREEERRRLRRDLHDGLGPQLAAIAMTIDIADSVNGRGDSGRTARLLRVAADQTAEAIADVRRRVRGLRPPALDELGLVGALTSSGLVAGLEQGSRRPGLRESGDGLVVSVTDDGSGFTPEDSPAGVGMSSMRERAGELGGTLRLHSVPGAGTTVTAVLPLHLGATR